MRRLRGASRYVLDRAVLQTREWVVRGAWVHTVSNPVGELMGFVDLMTSRQFGRLLGAMVARLVRDTGVESTRELLNHLADQAEEIIREST